MARDSGLSRKEMISMTIKMGINQRGIFLGRKMVKKPRPRWVKPIMIQAKKKQRDRLRVMTM